MKDEITSPLKAIKAHCIDCVGSVYEVKDCGGEDSCKLYAFRFGKNPYRKKRILSDERKAELAENLARGREKARGNKDV